jgi:hypothetical protein
MKEQPAHGTTFQAINGVQRFSHELLCVPQFQG